MGASQSTEATTANRSPASPMPSPGTVAALFVEEGGVYFGLEGVDPWPKSRDAMKYRGPHSVVAHPDCSRWCQMAPVNQARYGHKIGDDGGQFLAALAFVRLYGGVLEHPAYSLAWKKYGLRRPDPPGGWCPNFMPEPRYPGGRAWTALVYQRNYGHRAAKKTWLYYVGHEYPPPLIWGPGPKPEAWISTDRPRAELAAAGIAQLSKKEAKRTPEEFRDLLLSLARKSRNPDGKVEKSRFIEEEYMQARELFKGIL